MNWHMRGRDDTAPTDPASASCMCVHTDPPTPWETKKGKHTCNASIHGRAAGRREGGSGAVLARADARRSEHV